MNVLTLPVLSALLAISKSQNSGDSRKVVCYYTNWSINRVNQFAYKPTDINPYLCTHLIYAFAAFDMDNNLKPFDENQDISKGGYKAFNDVKIYNENVKTLLALGGWREGSKNFSPIAASEERRTAFSKNVLEYLRKYNFDGISLDWQFPGIRDDSTPQDITNYVELVKAIKEEFMKETEIVNKPSLIISISMPSNIEYIEKGFDYLKLQLFADIINIIGYDYHLANELTVNHPSPLFPLPEETGGHPNAKLNVASTVEYLRSGGAQLAKYTLGIPTYGRSFKLADRTAPALGSRARGLAREAGFKAYYEICNSLKFDKSWTLVQHNMTAMGPYAFKGDDWVGFDDEEIVRKKAKYGAEVGLGGIMFWTIDNDDFRGDCGRVNPLIKAGREGLASASRPARTPVEVDTPSATPDVEEIQSNTTGEPSPIIVTPTTTFPLSRSIAELASKPSRTLSRQAKSRMVEQILSTLEYAPPPTTETLLPGTIFQDTDKDGDSPLRTVKIWIVNNVFNF